MPVGHRTDQRVQRAVVRDIVQARPGACQGRQCLHIARIGHVHGREPADEGVTIRPGTAGAGLENEALRFRVLAGEDAADAIAIIGAGGVGDIVSELAWRTGDADLCTRGDRLPGSRAGPHMQASLALRQDIETEGHALAFNALQHRPQLEHVRLARDDNDAGIAAADLDRLDGIPAVPDHDRRRARIGDRKG